MPVAQAFTVESIAIHHGKLVLDTICARPMSLPTLTLAHPALVHRAALCTVAAPPLLAVAAGNLYQLTPEQATLAHHLAMLRLGLHFGTELAVLLLLAGLLESGLAGRLERAFERMFTRPWQRSVLFFALLLALLEGVVLLPGAAWMHAALVRVGISIQGWPGWLQDQLLGMLLVLLIGTPILLFARWLLVRSPHRAWLWFWMASIPVILAGALLLPQVVEPIFDHFEPLAATHPELVVQFERVVARTGTHIPPQRMFLMRASAKGNGLNAYVSGLGPTKRIVVWDTTADRMPQDEILFILAHESGHYVLHHLAWGIGMGIAGTLVLLWLTQQLAAWLLRWRGRAWKVAALGSLSGMVVLLLALAVLEAVSEPIGNSISRVIEHQADVYGQEAMHGIVADPQQTAVAAFQQLGRAWLEDPNPAPFVVFWTYDHPSIQSRASFAAHYDPWTKGNHPRYFAPTPGADPAATLRVP